MHTSKDYVCILKMSCKPIQAQLNPSVYYRMRVESMELLSSFSIIMYMQHIVGKNDVRVLWIVQIKIGYVKIGQ